MAISGFIGNRYVPEVSFPERTLGSEAMAKSPGKGSPNTSGSKNETVDKLAKAAMSKEMLAAGLAAAAAAISASPKARRAIRDAGLDAADTASSAASSMMASATKLGSLIAEAVADAAQRVLTGKWASDEAASSPSKTASAIDKHQQRPRTQARRQAETARAGSKAGKARKCDDDARQNRRVRERLARAAQARPKERRARVPSRSKHGKLADRWQKAATQQHSCSRRQGLARGERARTSSRKHIGNE